MAGQAQPLVRVTGTVHSTKTVTYEGGTNKAGNAYAGGSYGEVLILTEHSRLNGEVSDYPATLTMRVDASDLPKFGKGQILDALLSPFCDVIRHRGQFFNVVGYRFAAEVPAPAPSTGTRSSSSTPSGV